MTPPVGWSTCEKMEHSSPRSLSHHQSAPPSRPTPFSYVSLAQDAGDLNEKSTPLDSLPRPQGKNRPSALPIPTTSPYPSSAESSAQWTPYSYSPDAARQYPASAPPSSTFIRSPQLMPAHTRSRSSYPPPATSRASSTVFARLRPWLPLIMYAITTLAFVVAFGLYRAELFTCMSFAALRSEKIVMRCIVLTCYFSHVQTSMNCLCGCEPTRTTAMLFFFSLFFSLQFVRGIIDLFCPNVLADRLTYSPISSVLYPHYLIWIHFWPMDGRYHFLFCSASRCARCIYRLSLSLPGFHRTLAPVLHHNQTRRTRNRKTPQAALSYPPRSLSLQRYELPSGCFPHTHSSYLHRLHGALPLQGHHSHFRRRINPLVQGLPPGSRRVQCRQRR